jgi:hypothetical protein
VQRKQNRHPRRTFTTGLLHPDVAKPQVLVDLANDRYLMLPRDERDDVRQRYPVLSLSGTRFVEPAPSSEEEQNVVLARSQHGTTKPGVTLRPLSQFNAIPQIAAQVSGHLTKEIRLHRP